jgi:hypothetical protein
MRPTVYLYEITFASLPYALALSLRNRVVAWRIDVPDCFARRFGRLRAHKLFSWDEWLLLEDACYAQWKSTVLPHYRATFRCEVNYRSERLDFSPILWQHLGGSFERFPRFLALVKKHQAEGPGACRVVAPLIAGTLPSPLVAELSSGLRLVFSPIAGFFESAHYWIVSFLHVGLGVRNFMLGLLAKRIKAGRKKIFWTGISRQEIPDADHRLNFAWAAQYGELPREDVLFFLPARINARQKSYLDAQRLHYVDPAGMFRLISRRSGARALGTASVRLLLDLLSRPVLDGAYRARFLARALVWLEAANVLKPDFYFTTSTSSWPERPEVAALKQLGVRNIIWSYSANNLRYTIFKPFRDDTIDRSFFVADEFWSWNRAFSERLERIQTGPAPVTTRFRVVGTNMCGDRRHLDMSPAEARRFLGLPDTRFALGIFDVAPITDAWLDRDARGPRYIPLEYSEAFFSSVNVLLHRLPGLTVILKLKRSVRDPIRAFPASLHQLLDQKKNGSRVVVLDVNIDPYLPVAACDGALGTIFTSPVLIALANKRHGRYYDPLGIANFPTAKEHLQLTLRNEEALIDTVQSWIANPAQPQTPRIERLLPPAIKDSFRRICYDARSEVLEKP